MTTPPLDPGVLATLREIMGEDYPMLVETYLRDSEQRLAQLQATTDPRRLREAAHSFKGSSSNMGATGLAAWCGDLEHLALDAPAGQVAELVEKIVDAFARVKASFLADGASTQH